MSLAPFLLFYPIPLDFCRWISYNIIIYLNTMENYVDFWGRRA